MEDARHSGFTLIELLLTIALVALLAGLAVPSMAQFADRHRLRGAAEALAQELRLARNHALSYQKTTYFSASTPAPRQWCYGWDDTKKCNCHAERGNTDACESGATGSTRLHRQLSNAYPSVTLSLSRSALNRNLKFSAVRGTATADTLVVTNNAGELRIIVSPLGRVRTCSVSVRGYPPC
jgi:prepilin-type N-terminal cleavage/methylation domain-containing protein